MVFCLRSLSGWSVPKRTSALAARWKTKSQPAIAFVSAGSSRLSPSTNWKRVFFSALVTKGRCPVEKLSQPTTVLPSARSRSTRLLPMKPAAPVTNIFCMKKSGRFRREWHRTRHQAQADHEVVKNERKEREREETTGLDREIRVEFGDDFVRQVDVFAFDENIVGDVVGFLPDALGGH